MIVTVTYRRTVTRTGHAAVQTTETLATEPVDLDCAWAHTADGWFAWRLATDPEGVEHKIPSDLIYTLDFNKGDADDHPAA